jgi:hypothetical protein
MINKSCAWVKLLQPLFPFVGQLLTKGKINARIIHIILKLKEDPVLSQRTEVFFRLL